MTKQKPQADFISTAEAATILGVSRVTIFNHIKSDRLKAEKVGRNYVIAMSEINRFLGKQQPLNDEEKLQIDKAVKRAIKQYGTALRMLGKE